MNKEKEQLIEEFEHLIEDSAKFLFITRGKEFQQEAVEKLSALKQKISLFKEKAVEKEDEDSANLALGLELFISAFISELEMWMELKEDDPNKAWDYLADAQLFARDAAQAHRIVQERAERYANRLYLLEKLLFPPQIFLSPGIVHKREECSICGKEYGECEHIKGKAYMGKICYVIIREIQTFSEVSIVKEPANKRARVYQLTDEDGITRDLMTWKRIEKVD